MKCKWHKCNNEARAKSPFCSGTCKKRYQRFATPASGTNVPVEASGTKPEPHDAERNARGVEAIHQLLQIPDGKWTSLGPQDDSQSTNAGAVVAEHPDRSRLISIPGVGCRKPVGGA